MVAISGPLFCIEDTKASTQVKGGQPQADRDLFVETTEIVAFLSVLPAGCCFFDLGQTANPPVAIHLKSSILSA